MSTKTKSNTKNARLLLQVGLAAVFLYAGVSSLLNSAEWIGFLPGFLSSSASAANLIKLFAVYELLLAAWLLSGRYLKPAALLSAVTLGSIMVVNPHQLIITFRDIGLVFMALSLMALAADDK